MQGPEINFLNMLSIRCLGDIQTEMPKRRQDRDAELRRVWGREETPSNSQVFFALYFSRSPVG